MICVAEEKHRPPSPGRKRAGAQCGKRSNLHLGPHLETGSVDVPLLLRDNSEPTRVPCSAIGARDIGTLTVNAFSEEFY